MKMLATTILMVAAILVAGCSEQKGTSGDDKAQRQSDTPKKAQANNQKPKTVVVNEGMNKKQERELNQRLNDLENKVNGKSAQKTADRPAKPQPKSAADYALAAAQNYYAAAAAGNYTYTYSQLSSHAQSQFTEDEWIADNTALDSDAVGYDVDSARMVDDSTSEVHLTVTSPDGSSSERTTRFVLENGGWKHELTQPEYDLFASANTPASAPASTSANANTKHVEVVISSDEPADVSISDDSLDWFVNEQITGTKTYERDIAKNSGLSVEAVTDAYNAQTAIKVYEDDSLVAQDSDPHGDAVVTY